MNQKILTTLWLKLRHYDFKNPGFDLNSSRTICENFTLFLKTRFKICCNCRTHSFFLAWKTVFVMCVDILVTSWLVVQVWEVSVWGFWKIIPSGVIINSQLFLGKKAKKIEIKTCSIVQLYDFAEKFSSNSNSSFYTVFSIIN